MMDFPYIVDLLIMYIVFGLRQETILKMLRLHRKINISFILYYSGFSRWLSSQRLAYG